MTTYYKVLRSNGSDPMDNKIIPGGNPSDPAAVDGWQLPSYDNITPGDWMPNTHTYRGITLENLPRFVDKGPFISIMEFQGTVTADTYTVTGTPARIKSIYTNWDFRDLRQFAYDCAYHVLGVYEGATSNDQTVRNALAAIAAAWAASNAHPGDLTYDYTKPTSPSRVPLAVAEVAAWLKGLYSSPDLSTVAKQAVIAANYVVTGSPQYSMAALYAQKASGDATAERTWQGNRLLQYLNGTVTG